MKEFLFRGNFMCDQVANVYRESTRVLYFPIQLQGYHIQCLYQCGPQLNRDLRGVLVLNPGRC